MGSRREAQTFPPCLNRRGEGTPENRWRFNGNPPATTEVGPLDERFGARGRATWCELLGNWVGVDHTAMLWGTCGRCRAQVISGNAPHLHACTISQPDHC